MNGDHPKAYLYTNCTKIAIFLCVQFRGLEDYGDAALFEASNWAQKRAAVPFKLVRIATQSIQ